MLPVRRLSQHLAELGAAVAARTADKHPQPSSKQQFAAARHGSIERSLGEISLGQVQQPAQFSGASRLDVGQVVSLNGSVANQHHTRPPFEQGGSADNGITSGNYII